VSFFETPPPSPPEPEQIWFQPVWMGPPPNIVGSGIAFALVVARTEDVAVFVSSAVAYPTGITIHFGVRRRVASYNPSLNAWMGGHEIAPPDGLRFGLQFSDGTKVTTLDPHPTVDGNDPTALPDRPILMHNGGGGGGLSFDHECWVWPLPPPGPVEFVVEWLAEGIPLTRKEIDAGQVLEAADRAEVLWDLPEPSSSGGWTAYRPSA
jgi:hypothetical protein